MFQIENFVMQKSYGRHIFLSQLQKGLNDLSTVAATLLIGAKPVNLNLQRCPYELWSQQ